MHFNVEKKSRVARNVREGLTENERYAVADAVVWRLKEHGDPWKLSEELPAQTTDAARPWMPEDRQE